MIFSFNFHAVLTLRIIKIAKMYLYIVHEITKATMGQILKALI